MTARRARTPEVGDVGSSITAGEITGNDVGRLVELDFSWTPATSEQHVAGTLTRYRADSIGVLLHIDGDPSWPAIEGIPVERGHQVALGPYAARDAS